ncbi:transmembrane protein [Synechococcus phage S-CRES3]|nr:transmembrane protein [Synechococcus phage S-CRES3]
MRLTDKQTIWLRRAGVFCLITAYATITSGYLLPGILINSTGQLLMLPFALRFKMWDLCALSGFYLFLNLRILLLG